MRRIVTPLALAVAALVSAHAANVMAVTATDVSDRLFNSANQGKYITVAAPGVDILVPAPNGSVQFTTGTSVATANVSGVAALLIAQKPSVTPEEIRAILVRTAKHLGSRGINPQAAAAKLGSRPRAGGLFNGPNCA